MSTNDFTHLHLHTQYSFLDGAIRIKDLTKKIQELGMKQVAITDHGNMFGSLDFYMQCIQSDIKPIIGMEAYITGKAKHTDKIRENYHLVLLAENEIGYGNLKKLSSKAFLDGKYFFPRIDKQLLHKHREGLIVTTACLGGEVAKKCTKGDLDGARETIREFKSILGAKNFFLEIQPNGMKVQNTVNAQLAGFAKEEGLRIVATNDCHYVNQEEHDAQNILMAIRQQKSWDDPTLHKHETDAFYIRSGKEMWDLLKTDYASAFESACDIGKRCNLKLKLNENFLPNFTYPKIFETEADYLKVLASNGLKRRINEINYKIDREVYQNRLQLELDLITKMGFSGYFLIVQDFINWSKNRNIRVGPGRGSGAGSLVAFVLRITDIDPIPHNLLFERFLNPERISMPDLDIDFMQERRGEVIQYVSDHYGRNHVGQIATYSALNPKTAIKDVARTLGVGFSEINQLTKLMPNLIEGQRPDLEQALEHAPQILAKSTTSPIYKRIIATAKVLEGLYRQVGMHAAGIVISNKELTEYVPIFQGSHGELITQFDKEKIENVGLVKFDFLGLKTLDVIAQAEILINERLIKENKPLLIIDCLDPYASESKKIYDLIGSGDTLGVFQMESVGFQDLCRRLKPDSFEDIIAAAALYRPGPMQSGMVEEFIDRKHNRKKVIYPHFLLEEILKPTHGTFVYQEQILLATQILAGYSLGSADLLRQAMGKKKINEMLEQRAEFIKGCRKNQISSIQAGKIFDAIEKFAGYGFNKSHATAYALITYQTAYLKYHYPVEFMTSLLTTSSDSTEDIAKYMRRARNSHIKVLPPDINFSERKFTVEKGQIRFGLEGIKGLGSTALDSILEIRKQTGKFKNIFEICNRTLLKKINKKTLEALVKSGALDGLGYPRKQTFLTIEKAITFAQYYNKDAISGQGMLFDIANDDFEYDKNEEEWTEQEKLEFEKEVLGLYLSGHPLNEYKGEITKLKTLSTTDLKKIKHNETVSIIGIIANLKERPLKNGTGFWALFTIEDMHGYIEALIFNKTYQQFKEILKSNKVLLLKGQIIIEDQDNDDSPKHIVKIRIDTATELARPKKPNIDFIEITIGSATPKILEAIYKICKLNPGNKLVRLVFENCKNQDFVPQLLCSDKIKVAPSEQLLNDIRRIEGVKKIAGINLYSKVNNY